MLTVRPERIFLLSWVCLLVAIVATLLLAVPGVRYATLVTTTPTLTDENVRRLGYPLVSVLPAGFRLIAENDVRTRGLAWSLPVAAEATAVRVRGQLALLDVGAGEKGWHRAMLSVRMVDANAGKIWERHPFRGSGTQTQALDMVFLLPPEAVQLQLLLRLLYVSGSVSMEGLQVDWLAERAWVPPVLLLILALWILAFGALLVYWLHAARYQPALILSFVLVVVAVMAPGEWRGVVLHHLTPWLSDWLPARFDWRSLQAEGIEVSDYGHFLMFLLLGVALSVARPDLSAKHLLLGLLMLCLATEVVQLLVPGRDAGWWDVALNTAGSLIGLGLAALGRLGLRVR